MPANLTDNYVANTYKGVLHVNGEELPADAKVQVYDGAGNETAIKLGSNTVDCLSLSAYGLTANDFKYPEEASSKYSVVCQTSDEAEGGVNILELKPIQEVFCESDFSSYVRESESVVPIVTVECGIVQGVEDKEVVAITTAAGGITTNQSGNFSIAAANIEGGIVKGLSLTPASLAPTPNLLINAQGIINQRQMRTGATLNYDWNPKKYFLDRWKSNGGSPVTWSYNVNANIATIVAGGAGISQTIERVNIIPGSYTLSWTGNATATVRENNVIKVTGTGGSGSVKQLSVNMGGSGNVQITFTNGTFSLPKFERGIRTEFDYRDFGTELLLCQRYFNKTYQYSVRPGQQSPGFIVAHTTEPINPIFHNAGWRYQTTMRVKPQAWPFNPYNGTINQFSFLANRQNTSRPAKVSNWSDSGISTVDNTGAGLVAGVMRAVSVHYVVDAEF